MEFGLLGPLEVTNDGLSLRLGSSRQRALLALLLLRANEAVPLDQLVDGLWGDSPPKTAEQIVRIYVSQLRKLLEPERGAGDEPEVLLTRDAGYELRLRPDQLDTYRFEQLLQEGRNRLAADDGTALGYFRGALALWRGPALADFTYEPFAQAEIARLEELRLNAIQDRVEADLARGAHAAVVPELEALVERHPLRERLRAQLMLALYRSGRQAEALAAYQTARAFLRDELGIEPGTELKQLEGMMLRQEPTLERPAVRPPSLEDGMELGTREVRKPVTVLSAEITRVEGPADADPEARRHIRGGYAHAVERVFARYEATVVEWNDDTVTSLFGTPIAHEDDALRAVRAASELRDALLGREASENGEGALKCRIGVDTGEVLVSETVRDQPAVSGDVLSRAHGLHRSARWGEILIGDTTRRLVRSAVSLEAAHGSLDLTAWRVVSAAEDGARPVEAPLVGRDDELAQLRHSFDRAEAERIAYLFTLLGDPGIGKSRIVRELVSSVAGAATTLVGRCLSYGEGITFHPVVEMVVEAAGSSQESDIAAILGNSRDADLAARRLASLTGAAEVEATGEESFWAFRRLVETLAREHPLLLVFEDVHWAEPTLLELIEHVAERAADAPVLLVCTARPELLEKRPAWGGGKANAAALMLRPLRDEDAHALLDELVVSLPDEVRDRVIATAEGNPLFVEQLAAMLADAPAGPGPLPVPPTLQAVLAARLDRLGPGERTVLEAAAVIGREFEAAPVAQLVPGEARASTPRNLDTLVRKGLVRLLSGTFRFAHVLVQDATYRAIPKERRAQLHESFVGWLEQEPEERMAEQQEVVGYHLEQAFRYRTEVGFRDDHSSALAGRAAELLGAAGRRAVAREDFPAAENLLSRATALVEPDDPTRIELLPSLGRTLVMSGSFERGKMILDEACERLANSASQATHAHALAERGNLLFWRGGMLEESKREAARALEIFTALGDESGLANAWQLVSRVRRFYGVSDQRNALERAVEYARRAADPAREGDALHHICWALIDGPAPFGEILRYTESFWDWATATGDPSRLSNAAGPLTYVRAMQGRFDEARELHEWNTNNVAIRGHRIGVLSSAILTGRVEMLAQAPAAAESAFLFAYQQGLDTGLRVYLPWTAVRLARALLAQDRPAEAMQFLDAAQAEVSDDSVPFQLMLHGTRARAFAQGGDVEAAISVAGEGIRRARQTEYLLRLAQAQLDLGEVLSAADERVEARRHADEALRLFEYKGDVSSAATARRLIERTS